MTNPSVPRDADGSFSNPWWQAALTGALTLIPVRNYPRWLRRTLIWGLPVAGTIGFGYIAANPEARPQPGGRFFQEQESTEKVEDIEQYADGEARTSKTVPPLKPAMRAIVFVAGGAAVGTVLAGVLAAGFWADEKIDRGLRKLKVPLPRVVMGCAAGALTWWQVTNESRLKNQ